MPLARRNSSSDKRTSSPSIRKSKGSDFQSESPDNHHISYRKQANKHRVIQFSHVTLIISVHKLRFSLLSQNLEENRYLKRGAC